jgi:hypothetical protein
MENRGERKLESKIEHKEKGGPEISYHFFYSPHITAEDLGKIGKMLLMKRIFISLNFVVGPRKT